MKPRIALSKLAIVLGTTALLSACGAGKVVNTQDDSADYKTARSLPPLKKPAPVVVTQRAPVEVVEQQVETVKPVAEASTALETAQNDVALSEAPEAPLENLDDAVQTEEVAQAAEPVVAAPADVAPQVETLDASSAKYGASLVENDSGQARLNIDTGLDQAWVYLSESLAKSDITVFSRNKAAGRFSIGCANIAAAPTVTKKGRWSFFNRDRQPRLEYCALQAVEKRGATFVSVLNRSGEEVTAEYSRDVFKRLLSAY